MNSQPDNSKAVPEELQLDSAAVCDRCGRLGVFHFEQGRLCAECYQECGSCCPEFGQDDLWTSPANDAIKMQGF